MKNWRSFMFLGCHSLFFLQEIFKGKRCYDDTFSHNHTFVPLKRRILTNNCNKSFLGAKLLYITIRNARKMWFSRLLFRIDGWIFWLVECKLQQIHSPFYLFEQLFYNPLCPFPFQSLFAATQCYCMTSLNFVLVSH